MWNFHGVKGHHGAVIPIFEKNPALMTRLADKSIEGA